MPNLTPDFDANERELRDHLGETAGDNAHPSPELLLAFGQEVLAPEIEAGLEQHLRHCRLCSMLRADLETLPETLLSPAQSRRIAERLHSVRPATGAFPMRRVVALLAGIAAALLLVWGGRHFIGAHAPSEGGTSIAVKPPATPQPVMVAVLDVPVAPLAPPSDASTQLQTRGSRTRNPSTELLMPAFIAYRHGDYAIAAKRFERLSTSYPSSDIVSLYLGVSQLLDHQDTAANTTLQKARKLAPRSDAARWYGAVAALRVHSADAEPLFKSLCADARSTYSAESL